MAWLDDFLTENAPGEREAQKQRERMRILRKGPGAAPEIPVPEVITNEMGPFGYMTAPTAPQRPMVGPPEEAAYTGGATGSWGPPTTTPARASGSPSALPRATGRVQGPSGPQSVASGAVAGPAGAVAPQGPVDPYQAAIDKIEADRAKALAEQDERLKPPDRTASEAAYRKRAAGGTSQLALAMMAREAGFDPMSAYHLKQSAEMTAPQKMAGGVMTETGFIEDPAYQQEMELKRTDARIRALDQALAQATTRQDRMLLEKDKRAQEEKMIRLQIEGRKEIAGLMAAERRADREARTAGGGNASEDERKALTLLGQAENAANNARNVLTRNPKAAQPGTLETVVSAFGSGPIATGAKTMVQSADRQQFMQAASSFAEAALRAATGAGMGEHEARQKVQELTPVWGEDPATTKQKMDAWPVYLEGLRSRAGRAYLAQQGGGGRRSSDRTGGTVSYSDLPP